MWVCIFALFIWHANCMRRFISSSMACLAVSYFSKLYKKGTIFEINNLLNTKRVFWFALQILSEKFHIQRRIPQDIIMNVQRSSCTVPDSVFHKTWISSTYFRGTTRYQISWKCVCCVSRCSMRTDGRTDGRTYMKQLTVVLRNFANVSKEKIRKIFYGFAIITSLFGILFCGLGCQCVFWGPLILAFSGLVQY